MSEKRKKAGIIAGHILCIGIIIFCIVYGGSALNENADSPAVIQPSVTPEVTIPPTPTETVIPTKEPTPTETVIPTEEPVLTETVVPTEEPVPTETVVPTEEPVPTEPVAPTEEPVLTEPVAPTESPVPTATPIPIEVPEEITESESLSDLEIAKRQVVANISNGVYKEYDNTKYSWWFHRKDGHVPSGSGAAFNMKEFQGYYLNEAVKDGDKVVYMTIDCGFGSANTPVMLDIFKKHDIKVTFFVTKYFIDACPDYLRRMVEEGHTVGNHSVSHVDLTARSDEDVYREITGCEEAFFKVTGTQMAPYFRPPEGAYSKRTLQLTEDLGYKTIFWSIAYYDYNKQDQPGKAYVIDHFSTYHHNGAVPLMHNDSVSNMEAMDEVLTLLKEQGYRFGTLDELGK